MVQQRRKLFLSLVRGGTLVAWCRGSLLFLERWTYVSACLWESFRSSAPNWLAAPRGGEDRPASSATLTVDSSHLLWPSSQNCPPSVHQRVSDPENYCGNKSFQIMRKTSSCPLYFSPLFILFIQFRIFFLSPLQGHIKCRFFFLSSIKHFVIL